MDFAGQRPLHHMDSTQGGSMKRSIAFFCAAGICSAAVQAGTVVHFDRRDGADDKTRPQSVIYAQDGNFRMDTLDEKGHVQDFVLVRDGSIWQVDTEKRTFYKFDKSALSGQQDEMQQRMQAMLQSLPPERRAIMQARMQTMMQSLQQTSMTTTDTGHSDRAGSWSCEVWQLLRNGKPINESCVAPSSSLPGGEELVEATHKAAAVAQDVLASLPATRSAAQRFAVYGKFDGFPVRTREISGGTTESEDVATSIERRALPADTFAIPRGFTQTTLSGARN
jgi:hypothetical protein